MLYKSTSAEPPPTVEDNTRYENCSGIPTMNKLIKNIEHQLKKNKKAHLPFPQNSLNAIIQRHL